MSLTLVDVVAVLALSATAFALLRNVQQKRGLPLPPGPPKRFLLGNIPDMPKENEWLKYNEWKEQYGDLVHLQVGAQNIILVNTHEAAFDLFEKRSSIYSDRADFIMVNDFAGFDWSPSTMRYGSVWRLHRTLLHRQLHPTACEAYVSAQERHTRQMLCSISSCGTDAYTQIKQAVGALIMEITYGIQVKYPDDPWISLCEEAVDIFGRVTVPGAFMVDSLPFLKHIPEWLPGMGWKRQAREWKKTVTRLADAPFEQVRQDMASGQSYRRSVVADLLSQYTSEAEVHAVRNVGAIFYAAGTDTTAAVMHVFLLAMVLYPEAQKAAQAELNRVIGSSRLPSLADRSNLPYVNALLKEVYRWHPIQPLNGGHVNMQEDEYRGYRIPKGSSLHSNNWAMFNNPDVYGSDVSAFRPERFLGPNPPRDASAVFGYGRRACAGRFLADNTVFIMAVCMLAVFDITPPTGGSKPEPKFRSGFFSPPLSFECSLVLRSDAAQALLDGHDQLN